MEIALSQMESANSDTPATTGQTRTSSATARNTRLLHTNGALKICRLTRLNSETHTEAHIDNLVRLPAKNGRP